jgi:hypothetical protein
MLAGRAFGSQTVRSRDGYVVLEEFDTPALGGNGNGFIDREDRVYGELV